MSNARFATAVHIISLLSRSENELLSSGFLAGSININPAMVRKEITVLVKKGLVESREGKNGGCRLAKKPSAIKLGEVYEAVREGSILGLVKNSPNPYCPIGKQINQHLEGLYTDAETALIRTLQKKTLADFLKPFV